MSNNVALHAVRIHLSALGCRLNEAELEQWAGAFAAKGDYVTDDASSADVLVLNTCAVTTEAVRKSRQRIQRLQRNNPSAKLVVSGCYSSLASPESLAELGIDLIVNNADKDALVLKTREAFSTPVMPESATVPEQSALFQRNRQRAFIKIQDGCRYRCTFCIVTVARGAEKSRPIGVIIDEVQQLADSGIHEIVLTGVHVGGYGSDLGSNLQALVKALLEHTSIERIRFASVEPWDLSDEFLTLFGNNRVMPHMHLPLQSGSNTVLRRMARRCKTADFAQLVTTLREQVADFNITTDIIVGFPGETEAEWQETLSFVDQINFGHMHIFSYSKRDGTKAATLPNPVEKKVRRQRSQQLHAIAAEQKVKIAQSTLVNSGDNPVDVLWETGEQLPNGQYRHSGYTPNYLRITTESDQNLTNLITPTRLTGHHEHMLLGTALTPPAPENTAG